MVFEFYFNTIVAKNNNNKKREMKQEELTSENWVSVSRVKGIAHAKSQWRSAGGQWG
jgi:hypothetical protein